MRTNYVEVFVGTLVVIAATIFLSYAYRFQTTRVHYPLHLQAIFERVDGIVIGSDVKLRGIKVGQVSKLALNEKDLRAKLTLSFFENYSFPDDSIVEVASEGLMGPKYISIVPGDSDTFLHNGEEAVYTQSSISLESLLAKFVFSAPKEDEKK